MKGIQKPLCAGWDITQEILTSDYRMVSIPSFLSLSLSLSWNTQMLIIIAVILQVAQGEEKEEQQQQREKHVGRM